MLNVQSLILHLQKPIVFTTTRCTRILIVSRRRWLIVGRGWWLIGRRGWLIRRWWLRLIGDILGRLRLIREILGRLRLIRDILGRLWGWEFLHTHRLWFLLVLHLTIRVVTFVDVLVSHVEETQQYDHNDKDDHAYDHWLCCPGCAHTNGVIETRGFREELTWSAHRWYWSYWAKSDIRVVTFVHLIHRNSRGFQIHDLNFGKFSRFKLLQLIFLY